MAIKDRFSFKSRSANEAQHPIHHESRGTTPVYERPREFSSPVNWYTGKGEDLVTVPVFGSGTQQGGFPDDGGSDWTIDTPYPSEPDIVLDYQPTKSSNPPRPRTTAMGYDSDSQTLRIQFRDGAVYDYFNVTEEQYAQISKTWSPGKWMNRNLLNDYTRLE